MYPINLQSHFHLLLVLQIQILLVVLCRIRPWVRFRNVLVFCFLLVGLSTKDFAILDIKFGFRLSKCSPGINLLGYTTGILS